MKTVSGYTLVELMITISIAAVLTGAGLSAYTKGRDRQIGQNAAEQIISFLSEKQQLASIGNKDCLGKYLGITVEILASSSELTSQSICEDGEVGVEETLNIPNISFNQTLTLTFNPLTHGIDLGANIDETTLTFTSPSALIYSLKLTKSGTIEYLGAE